MIYPKFLDQNSTIGVTAPSGGNSSELDVFRTDNAIKKFQDKGYKVIETPNVRTSYKGRSSDGKSRAKELEDLLENEQVDWIISLNGGDFLVEMLSFFDINKFKTHPKWFQGYSDNTGIGFMITTNCDVATLYGANFREFGMEPWHKCLVDNLELLQGNMIEQSSFDLYEDEYTDSITGLEGYSLTKPVNWRNITTSGSIDMSGRLIGGCIDVILNLFGTRFDNTRNFVQKYKEDGFIWYLESFMLNSDALTRVLWQMKESGWFDYVKGFIFGRPAFYEPLYDIPYEEAVLSVLEEYNVPIILDADIGHRSPQVTLINGAIATIHSEGGKGTISFELK